MPGIEPPLLAAAVNSILSGTEWADWRAVKMPGDADARCYWRLKDPESGATAILMDMSISPAASFAAFCRIGMHLRGIGLAAPRILHQQAGAQILLLEDLGPHTVGAAVAAMPSREPSLYCAATRGILTIQSVPPPTRLTRLTPDVGAEMLGPLFEYFVRRPDAAIDLEFAMADALATHAGPADHLSLRDYFSENLIWRSHLTGLDRLGILDFQDAFVAPAAYDLTSLIRDARRDVSTAASEAALTLFADQTGTTRARLDTAVAVLSVQRNLRILGIFARLARRDGKTRYLPMIPRVRAHVLQDVAHPALGALRAPVAAALSGASLL